MTTSTFENPYFEHVAGSGVTVGPCRDSYNDEAYELLGKRDRLVEEFAWAIPNIDAIEVLVDHDPILEVGAGTGYWAWCVEQLGGEVIATDPHPPRVDPYTEVMTYTALEAIETVREYEPEPYTLFCCWPQHEASWPADALNEYQGETFVYVGEARGGCTADERFHRKLRRRWTLRKTVYVPTYLGRQDRLEVWSRG